jgi:hypothetical protein
VSIERFLRQRAVDLMMDGTYILPNWYDPQGRLRTFACRATRVSPFRMIVEVPVVGKVGDSLTSYFQDFGHFEGTISDTTKGGLLLELEMTRAMRAKLAEKLLWLEKKAKDPFSISVYTLKELILREWREEWEAAPSSPSSIRLIYFGRLLDDKTPLKGTAQAGSAYLPV